VSAIQTAAAIKGPASRCSLVISRVERRYSAGRYLRGCKTTMVKWGHSAEGECRILTCCCRGNEWVFHHLESQVEGGKVDVFTRSALLAVAQLFKL